MKGHDYLTEAFEAERIAQHAIKLTAALNRQWMQDNVNWKAEIRREVLYLRRKLAEMEKRLYPPARGR